MGQVINTFDWQILPVITLQSLKNGTVLGIDLYFSHLGTEILRLIEQAGGRCNYWRPILVPDVINLPRAEMPIGRNL